MKKLKFVSLMVAALFMGFSFTSCEEDGSLLEVDPDDENNQSATELTISEGETSSATAYVSDLEAGETSIEVDVTFQSTDTKMRRLYMTQNIEGAGAEAFELENYVEGLDTKPDGSLDLSGENGYEVTYKIPFPVLNDVEGTVEYKIWATSGRGDYRDTEKRLVAGPGTITVDYGGSNPATAVTEYTAKMLAAPAADGSSETFISLIDGGIYRIDQGEEFAAFWDFGYYWLQSEGASLASPSDYRTDVVDVATVANTTNDELNNFYFASSDMDFDAVMNASDLDGISESSSETINNLSEGDVIEFVDNYGKKGLIKVVEIEAGWNPSDYIVLDIKVQP